MRQYSFYPCQPKHLGFLILVSLFSVGFAQSLSATAPYFFVKSKEVRTDGYTSITVLINNLPEGLNTLKFKVKADNIEKVASIAVSGLKLVKPNSWQYTWQGLIPIGRIEIKLTDVNDKDICKAKKEYTTLLKNTGLPTFKNTDNIASKIPERDSLLKYTIKLKEVKNLDKVFVVVSEEKTRKTIFQYLDKPQFVFSFEARGKDFVLLARGYREDGSSVALENN